MDNQTPWPEQIVVAREGSHRFVIRTASDLVVFAVDPELAWDSSGPGHDWAVSEDSKAYTPEGPPPGTSGAVTAMSDAGLKFLAYLEGGVRTHPYDDLTGKPWDGEAPLQGHLALGVGRTLFDGTYTPEQLSLWMDVGLDPSTALLWLREDADTAAQAVSKLQAEMSDTGALSLMQHQFDALTCFVFNIGVQAFTKSTLRLGLVDASVREGGGPPRIPTPCADHPAMRNVVAREMPRWKYSRGKVIPGLLNRRNETIELFCEADYTPQWFTGPRFVGPAYPTG